MEKNQANQVDDYIKNLAEELGDQIESSDAPPPPSGEAPATTEAGWSPDLNPTQQEIFDDPSPNILGHGEKGSGKTIGFAHKIVRHAYENNNALVLIIAPSMRTGNEGIWHDIDTLVLPAWRDGMELEYTGSKLDPYTKDRHRWIKNRFGGWSKLLLMSIPHASMVENRIKGPAPSMVYVDELTNCEGTEYYKYPAAQLGRRRDIEGPQQYCASCNPEGPSHWVYKLFWDEASIKDAETKEPWTDENGGRMGKDGICRDPDYAVYHVPFTENAHRVPPGYLARLEKIFRTDPIERRRLIGGEWIDRPTGNGLFKDWFNGVIHVRGDAKNGTGLRPTPGFPIIVGYDLGPMWPSITFVQLIPTKSKAVWVVFDEIDYHGKRTLYRRLAMEVIDRMRHWKNLIGFDFSYMHITDESAVNQWRAGGEGSYDAYDFEREYNKVIKEFSGQQMKLIGCPKGKGSVSARVRLLQSKLYSEEIFISATCQNTRNMLMFLEDDPDNPGHPKRSKHIHKFDSLTYPMHKIEMSGGTSLFLHTDRVAPRLIRVGM